jgi:hypothetical protein
MDSETYEPQLTAEVPVPEVEKGVLDSVEGPLPRRLAEVAGRTRAIRGVLALIATLALVALVQGLLLGRVFRNAPLVVYQDRAPESVVKP